MIIIGGLTRTGKSSAADAIFGDTIYHKLGEINDKWFDGFDPSKHIAILFNDVEINKDTGRRILRLADHYPFTVEEKGGSVFVNCQWIVVTS